MDYRTIWNDICFAIKRNQNTSEKEFQSVVELLFEKLGWSQYKGEIVSKETIPLGSAQSLKPDILIKNNSRTLFVVELKKPNAAITNRHGEQLFSYMRQLKLKFGILFGSALQVYYELPDSDKTPSLVITIYFEMDSDDGIKLIKILCKDEYSEENFDKYCAENLLNMEMQKKSQRYINVLCSQEGIEIVSGLIMNKISAEFSAEIASAIMGKININITKKEKPVSLPPLQRTKPENRTEKKKIHTLSKEEAIELCSENGIDVNMRITFASKNIGSGLYWANPNMLLLSGNWLLLLNDYENKNLHIFTIPTNSITTAQIVTRQDNGKTHLIDLQIRYYNEDFVDLRSGISFKQWYMRTLNY